MGCIREAGLPGALGSAGAGKASIYDQWCNIITLLACIIAQRMYQSPAMHMLSKQLVPEHRTSVRARN